MHVPHRKGAPGHMLAAWTAHVEGLVLSHLSLDLWQINPLTPFVAFSWKFLLEACLTVCTLLWAHHDDLIGHLDQVASAPSMAFLPSWFFAALLPQAPRLFGIPIS